MRDLKFMTGSAVEKLARHVPVVSDDSWYDTRNGGRVIIGERAKIFVKSGCHVTVGSTARLIINNGMFFVLGNVVLLPRADVNLYGGMLVLGDCRVGSGAVIACDKRVWIVDADIGAMCHIADTPGCHVFDPSGVEVTCREPVVIHENVFVSPGSMVLHGADVGAGAVIGPRSVVTGPVPAGCYAVGSPAVPVESGVTWTRSEFDVNAAL